MVLETKQVNDERTSCHTCLASTRVATGEAGVQQFFAIGACRHKNLQGTFGCYDVDTDTVWDYYPIEKIVIL